MGTKSWVGVGLVDLVDVQFEGIFRALPSLCLSFWEVNPTEDSHIGGISLYTSRICQRGPSSGEQGRVPHSTSRH